MKRILLCIPEELLAAIDHEAKAYYVNRSDLIRQACIYYLRSPAQPQRQPGDAGEATEAMPEAMYTDPQEMLKILQRQRLRGGVRTMLYDMKRDNGKRNRGG